MSCDFIAVPNGTFAENKPALAMTTISTLVPRLPKAVLHTHLEGSIPRQAVTALARRNGIDPYLALPKISDFGASLSGDWPSFARTIRAVFSCFQKAQDFCDAVVAYAESLVRENVAYAEIHCSPWKHVKRGVSLKSLEEGLTDGMRQANRVHGVNIKIICDLVRDHDEEAERLLTWLSDLPREDWPAIGISGGLDSVPLRQMRAICDTAHSYGLYVVVHAGELSGPDSVRTAIDDLKADRVCHGVRALEDPALTETILERGIHLELCPTANRLLHIGEPNYQSIARLLQLKANCSINPDDELLFDTSLTQEYALLDRSGIIQPADLLRLQTSAFEAAFLSDAEKVQYLSRLRTAWNAQ